MRVGFAILSYDEPAQLLRLTLTLSRTYSDPCIVVHHNFSQCALDTEGFPANVVFVRPHLDTGWGSLETVRAALSAIDLVRTTADPDWTFLLSGRDYPVMPGDKACALLAARRTDALLVHQSIDLPLPRHAPRPSVGGFHDGAWARLAYDRYVTEDVQVPLLSWKRPRWHGLPIKRRRIRIRSRPVTWIIRHVRTPVIGRRFLWTVYGGDFWLAVNRVAATRLAAVAPRVMRALGNRPIPEEVVLHTVLGNSGLELGQDGNRRYSDWSAGGSHPKWLTEQDLDAIGASGAMFARKFRNDDGVLDLVDRRLLRF